VADPYRVSLDDEQRAELRTLVGAGVAPARMLTRARVLLKGDHGEGGPGWSDAAIAGGLDVQASTAQRVRRQVVAGGLAPTLARKRPDRVYERASDGWQEAHLVALACAEASAGRARWSLRLLAGEPCAWRWRRAVSHETVRRTLKQTP
jgi:hypothetical protein